MISTRLPLCHRWLRRSLVACSTIVVLIAGCSTNEQEAPPAGQPPLGGGLLAASYFSSDWVELSQDQIDSLLEDGRSAGCSEDSDRSMYEEAEAMTAFASRQGSFALAARFSYPSEQDASEQFAAYRALMAG